MTSIFSHPIFINDARGRCRECEMNNNDKKKKEETTQCLQFTIDIKIIHPLEVGYQTSCSTCQHRMGHHYRPEPFSHAILIQQHKEKYRDYLPTPSQVEQESVPLLLGSSRTTLTP